MRTTLVLFATLALAACGTQDAGDKLIKSEKAGELTVSLTSSSGRLRSGENTLMLVFTDANGNPVDVGAVSLRFQMPAMGSMPEMTNEATLTTTEMPGRYRGVVNIEMKGTWEAIVSYEGERGSGQVRMTVNAS